MPPESSLGRHQIVEACAAGYLLDAEVARKQEAGRYSGPRLVQDNMGSRPQITREEAREVRRAQAY